MSDILSKFLLITEHVKTDLKNSESYPDLIFPLNALHSAMALLGFKEDNLLVLRLKELIECYSDRNYINRNNNNIENAKKDVTQLIIYVCEEANIIDSVNHNE